MSGYGAIETKDPDVSFEEYNVNYVQERTLSLKEKMQKLLTAGVPILVALLLMLGFGVWASHALSPQRQHSNHQYIPVGPSEPVPSPTFPSHSTTSSPPPPPKASSSEGAACSANPACAKLDLIGDCCPTGDGTMLGCC